LALVLAARAAGETVARGDQRLAGRYACYRVYACSGGGFYSVAALEPKFWGALCEAVGRQDLVGLQFAEGEDGNRVHRAMEEVFASRTRDEWQVALARVDACCEPVLAPDEVATHPQVAARGLVSVEAGRVEVRPAVRMIEASRRRDAPGLGEHTAEVLAELGIDAGRYGELMSDGVI
ncbi:MAG TPA: CoA transferase, partial [Candidatus Sulfotelmatobacter sp.]|nr:CoA transferase [Candidatus Sulfotelmatobacter sp.]